MKLLWGALALLCAGAAQASENWLSVAMTSEWEPVYVSRASVRVKDRVVTFWQKVEQRNGNLTFSRISINCSDDTWAMLNSQIRDAEGKSLDINNVAQPFTAIPPETVIDSIRLIVCSALKK